MSKISVFNAPVSNTTNYTNYGWKEFCKLFDSPKIVKVVDGKPDKKEKEDCGYFVRGKIKGSRNDKYLKKCCLIILDLDKGNAPPIKDLKSALDKLGVAYIAHTTATPGNARVVVLSDPYHKDQTELITKEFLKEVSIELDAANESKVRSQAWFLPQAKTKKSFKCVVSDFQTPFQHSDPEVAERPTQKESDTYNKKFKPTDTKKIACMLKKINPNDLNNHWHKIGMCIHFETGGSDEGLELFHAFTSGSLYGIKADEYDAEDLESRWLSFGGKSSSESVKIGTLKKIVKELRPKAKIKVGGVKLSIKKESRTLTIPESVLDCGGLIGLGMEALSQKGLPNIPQYNLPVVLTAIANATGACLMFGGKTANLYNIKVGSTSTGKSTSDENLQRELKAEWFYGATSFASGAALLRSVNENRRCLVVVDEASSIFKTHGKDDQHAASKRDALLELYTKTGGKIQKAYSDSKQNITIENPVVSVLGNATPTIFDTITQDDFETGLLQRFDFWMYEGDAPFREETFAVKNKPLMKFCRAIEKIHKIEKMVALRIDAEGSKLLKNYSTQIVIRGNNATEDSMKGIISRCYDSAKKYAIIHYASRTKPGKYKGQLMKVDIEFGIAIAEMLADWKLKHLYECVSNGEFADKQDYLLDGIRRIVNRGQKATYAMLRNRNRKIKNWKEKEFEDVIDVLISGNLIRENEDESYEPI